ncbi:unnamed protein product [Rangifer tarandus platyrhynchus]|uniref:Uncharacterized protein n=2 Tax=Rangifer tarandus platyrhynchus TaxID=3082113 RepID=A0ABN8YWY8_RANTA|nr:unnamed protein product [Rangifer tarandus platyrhynchus]CAI9693894.1 unnamed protein product [Rangifer tarandus platyrhynchus]
MVVGLPGPHPQNVPSTPNQTLPSRSSRPPPSPPPQPHLGPLGSVEMLALLWLFHAETPGAGLLSDLRLCWGPDPASLCTSPGLQRYRELESHLPSPKEGRWKAGELGINSSAFAYYNRSRKKP